MRKAFYRQVVSVADHKGGGGMKSTEEVAWDLEIWRRVTDEQSIPHKAMLGRTKLIIQHLSVMHTYASLKTFKRLVCIL